MKIIINLIKYFFYFFFAPLFVLIIILLRPLIRIRIGKLNTSRIGHFTTNTAKYYIYNKLIYKNHYLDLFYCDRVIANSFLLSMWSKKINILPRLFLFSIYKVIISFDYTKKYHYADNNKDGDQDPDKIIEKFDSVLKFSQTDKDRGSDILNKMGVNNRKIILFCSRDDSYANYMQTKNIDISYHSYRNSDINNYLVAAEELAKKGFALIRVGSKVKKKIITNSKYVIDYSTSIYQSDFMDVYLQSICYFIISNGSGINELARIFKKPILYVNFIPYAYSPTYQSKLICNYKKVYDEKKKKYLSLREMFESGVAQAYSKKEFDERKITLYENTPEEIKNASFEMLEAIKNNFVISKRNRDIHDKFWNIYYECVKKYAPYRLGGRDSYSMQIGNKFLNDNLYLLD